MADWDIIPPPSSMTVNHDHRAVLYLPDGRALVRQAGFRAEASHAVPRLSEAIRKVPRARRKGEK